MKDRIVIIGAGGHAGVVVDLLVSQETYEIAGLTDPASEKWGYHSPRSRDTRRG